MTETILANLERWRWMPHDLGKTYVIVNLPDYTLRVMNNGKRGLEDEDRHRQTRHADADHVRDDEIHHHQSDLARTAVDRQ